MGVISQENTSALLMLISYNYDVDVIASESHIYIYTVNVYNNPTSLDSISQIALILVDFYAACQQHSNVWDASLCARSVARPLQRIHNYLFPTLAASQGQIYLHCMPNTYSTRQEENQQNSCPGSCCTTCTGACLQRARTEISCTLAKKAGTAKETCQCLRNAKPIEESENHKEIWR